MLTELRSPRMFTFAHRIRFPIPREDCACAYLDLWSCGVRPSNAGTPESGPSADTRMAIRCGRGTQNGSTRRTKNQMIGCLRVPLRPAKTCIWGQTIMRSFIHPGAMKIGIAHIGWHTFRHTYSTRLRAIKADIKEMQELLRHASSRVTLDTYTQAVTIHKRRAQSRVIRLFRAPAVAAA